MVFQHVQQFRVIYFQQHTGYLTREFWIHVLKTNILTLIIIKKYGNYTLLSVVQKKNKSITWGYVC